MTGYVSRFAPRFKRLVVRSVDNGGMRSTLMATVAAAEIWRWTTAN